MRLDLYQAETERIASEQAFLLDEARVRLAAGEALSRLEESGVLHALQVLIENAIGKAKNQLKALGEPVPVSAHDAFSSLIRRGMLSEVAGQWSSIVGIRNRIVHDYMNIDMAVIRTLVIADQYRFVVNYLRSPIAGASANQDS
jgi:uncharacterized protein YutE (UPF0331/DUF86 family)